MLAHTNLVREKPVLQSRFISETHWHFTYGIALLMLVLLVNQGLMLEGNSEVTSITNSESVNDATDIQTIKHKAAAVEKIVATLKQRIDELSLEGRIRISNQEGQPLTLSINAGLLFSEGDDQLSRAGSFALQSLTQNSGLESLKKITIILEKRKDTPVEFSYGKEIRELEKERELVLQKFLSTFQVKAAIRQ